MNPPKSVPQVAEAKAEAELTVALRTAFHDTKPDQADFAMPAIRQRKRSMAGLSAASSCQRGTGEDAGYQETVATNTSVRRQPAASGVPWHTAYSSATGGPTTAFSRNMDLWRGGLRAS